MDTEKESRRAEDLTAPAFQTDSQLVADSELRQFISKIFLSQSELRVGWRLVLYFAMAGVIYFLGIDAMQFVQPRRVEFLIRMSVGELIYLCAAIVPALVMARFEGRNWGEFGLPAKNAFARLFWVGMSWGILSLTVLMIALRGVGVFYFGTLTLHGPRIVKFAVFWAMFFLLVGLFEEFLLRGYTQFTLSQSMGFWPAAIVLSLAFGGIHLGNKGEGMVGALAAAAIGFFFCLTLRRTGNLWFAVGFHLSWDWGETFLYSVPNSGTKLPGHLLSSTFHGSPWLSGGSVGPEGSVLAFVTVALLWVTFDRMYPEVKYKTAREQSAFQQFSPAEIA
jgi:membrane protease YdiL (CAAX protease family)